MREREQFDLIVSSLEELFSIPPQDRTVSPQDIVAERTRNCVNLTSAELTFMYSCVSGLARLEKLCDDVFKGYCRYCHRVKKTDHCAMLLMAFMMIFKYREIGGTKIREMFSFATDIGCVTEYLDYLLNIDAVMSTAHPLWLQSYDISFIDSVVLKNLQDIQFDAQRDVLAWLRARAEITAPILHHSNSGQHLDASISSQEKERYSKTFPPQSSLGIASGKKTVKDLNRAANVNQRNGIDHQLTVRLSDSSPQGEGNYGFPFLPSSSLFPPDVPLESQLRQDLYAEKGNISTGDPRIFSANGKLKLPPHGVREMEHTYGLPKKDPIPVLLPPLPYPKKPLTKPIGFSFHQREQSSSLSRARDTREEKRAVGAPSDKEVSMTECKVIEAGVRNNSLHLERPNPLRNKDPGEPPKTNAATLLREAYVYEKRRKNEKETLDEMERAPVDFKSFDRWKEREILKEMHQKEMNLLERHAAALEEENMAQEKRKEALEKRIKQAKKEREKKSKDEERKAKIKMRELELQKQNIRYTNECNSILRSTALEKTMHRKAEARTELKQELLRRKEEADEKEEVAKLERKEIISDIKKIRERAKQHRIKRADDNRMAAWEKPKLHELYLESMSIMELRNELKILREISQQENEERRQMIREKRRRLIEKKEELFLLCQKERKRAKDVHEAATAVLKDEQDAAKAANNAIEVNHMMVLHDKLEAKRMQHRDSLAKLREMERQHRNKVLLRAEDYFGKEQHRMEQEERAYIKRVNAAQAEYAELSPHHPSYYS